MELFIAIVLMLSHGSYELCHKYPDKCVPVDQIPEISDGK